VEELLKPIYFYVEIYIEAFKIHKLPGIYHISAEMIRTANWMGIRGR
jgi:hypothetical protein